MFLLTPLAASLTSALIAAIWQSLLLAVVVALCLRLIPTLTAAARSMVWRTVAVLAVLLYFTQVSSPHLSPRGALLARAFSLDPRWSVVVAVLWAVASGARAIQFVVGAFALCRLAHAATPVVPSDPACASLLAQSRRFESRAAELCTSTEVDRPSVLGFFRPRVLLPASLLSTLTAAELEQVLLHEVEHLRRRDDWANLLGRVALVVFPLNPVLLWIERRLATERELACDERVLEATGARKAYAVCLAHIAEHALVQRGLALALALVGGSSRPGRSELAHRVNRILIRPTHTLNPRTSTALVAVVIAFATGGSIELAHAPQLIRFASPQPEISANISTQASGPLLPIAFHAHTGASPFVMTNAVFSSQVHSMSRSSRPKRSVAEGSASSRQPVRWSVAQAPSVRLTSFEPRTSDSEVQLTLTVVSPNRFSYAAVPVQGGWILVVLPIPAIQPALTLKL